MAMKFPALLLFLVLLLTGCTTVAKYEPKVAPIPSKPADYPIYIYPENVKVPRPFEIIGAMHLRDTPLTTFGGSFEAELKKLQQTARREGADALQLTSVQKPDFLHSSHRMDANLIRFTDVWESVSLTEEELLAYFRAHERTLDPIEGIWSGNDAVRSRVGIMKDKAGPGRTFIAFILDSMNPGWQRGDKKMELAGGEWPWVYRGYYYLDDYRPIRIVFTLRSPRTNIIIQLSEDEMPVIFLKESTAFAPSR